MTSLTHDAIVSMQMERLRTAPPIVLWLTQTVGCWVIGSRAGFRHVRIHDASDWDILVPFSLWSTVVGGLPIEKISPTKLGGYRFAACFNDAAKPTVLVDVWPGDVSSYLTRPYVHVAWHPQTGTVIEKMMPEPGGGNS